MKVTPSSSGFTSSNWTWSAGDRLLMTLAYQPPELLHLSYCEWLFYCEAVYRATFYCISCHQ